MKTRTSRPWYFGYLIAACRKIWRWSKVRRQVKIKAKEICNKCGLHSDELQIDHIKPVLAGQEWPGWDLYIKRLLEAKEEDLQALCKECHNVKTKRERRRAA